MNKMSTVLRMFLFTILFTISIGLWFLWGSLLNDFNRVNRQMEAGKFLNKWTESVPVGSKVSHFELPLLEGGTLSLKTLKAKLTLFIFFKPTDCPACLLEAKLWRDIDESYSEVDVFGVTDSPVDNYKMSIFKRGKNISFPILLDDAGRIKRKFGITETPTKVIVDRSFKILDASASTSSPIAHGLFIKKINYLLKK